jgi:PDZ domain-containing protein
MFIFLKRFKKLFIALSFPYLYVLFLLVMPTGNQILAPGGLTPVHASVQIEGVTMNTQFHTIYVYNYYPMTPFQGFLASMGDRMEVYPLSVREKDTSWRDEYLSGQVSKLSSLQISIIQAYELASLEDDNITIQHHFGGLLLSYRPSRIKDLEIGDIVVRIDGKNYADYDEGAFYAFSRARQADLTIKRVKGDQVTYHQVSYNLEEGEPDLRYYPNYVIDHASPQFTLPGLDSVIGGPSGGMMQTLSIYVSLLKLNIGHAKIAGTGTINSDGSIGKIGGIKQKIYTAADEKVAIFFIPRAHLVDIQGMKYPFDLIAVSTIEEAVSALHDAIN